MTKSKSGLYDCPYCGSGSGPHGTGALKLYDATNTWYCHACHKGGDIIDLYRQQTGADYNTALSLLAQQIGVTIDPYRPDARPGFAPVPQGDPAEGRRSDFNGGRNDFSGRWNTETHQETKSAGEAVKTPKTANADFTGYYQECRERLTDPAAVAYLQRRGIDPATAAAYWIGFDPAADPANAPGAGADTKKPHPCPRLIVPTSAGHYIARRIDGQKEFEKLNPAGNLPRQVLDAAQEYKEAVADRISIVEGNFSCNISFIGDYIRQYIRRTGTRPIVFIDYLQILQPAADTRRQSTKETGTRQSWICGYGAPMRNRRNPARA